MKSGQATRLLTRNLLLFLILVTTAAAVFGQTAEPVQIAANTVTIQTQKPSGDISPSSNALQGRIDAQQQQIDQLNALIQKLQAALQPVASTRPMVPMTSIGFFPDASPSPSPSPVVSSESNPPRELLPDIGHIGAELGFFAGASTNPYKADKGFFTGGYIDLPWKKVPGGKLSYEIMIGLQRSVTTTQTTSGVNALVNTAINNYLTFAGVELPSLTNYLAGPLPITNTVQERAKVLTVAPFELKYTVTKLGRFRPYVVGGIGAYVWIGSDNNRGTFDAVSALNTYGDQIGISGLSDLPVGSSSLGATVNALLQGSQIGGLAPTAPELAARGVPHGQGNLLFGGQIGGGAEIRITPKLSIGVDFRHNAVEGKNASFNTFAFQQGLHW